MMPAVEGALWTMGQGHGRKAACHETGLRRRFIWVQGERRPVTSTMAVWAEMEAGGPGGGWRRSRCREVVMFSPNSPGARGKPSWAEDRRRGSAWRRWTWVRLGWVGSRLSEVAMAGRWRRKWASPSDAQAGGGDGCSRCWLFAEAVGGAEADGEDTWLGWDRGGHCGLSVRVWEVECDSIVGEGKGEGGDVEPGGELVEEVRAGMGLPDSPRTRLRVLASRLPRSAVKRSEGTKGAADLLDGGAVAALRASE